MIKCKIVQIAIILTVTRNTLDIPPFNIYDTYISKCAPPAFFLVNLTLFLTLFLILLLQFNILKMINKRVTILPIQVAIHHSVKNTRTLNSDTQEQKMGSSISRYLKHRLT